MAAFYNPETKAFDIRPASVEEFSSKLPTHRTADPEKYRQYAGCILKTLSSLTGGWSEIAVPCDSI